MRTLSKIHFASILILSICVVGLASEESDERTNRSEPNWSYSETQIRAGVALLQEGRFEAALATFDATVKADPRDMKAQFFKGVALNRLGRQDEALDPLMKAEKGGYTNPDMNFEIGWALMAGGLFNQAVRRFEAYEKTHPGRGQTSEFMGRCYLELGQFDRAEKLFEQALQRDARLEPTVLFYRARLEALRGDPKTGAEHLRKLMTDAPDSPIGNYFERLMRGDSQQLSQRKEPDGKPWRVDLTISGGYNSNAIALSDDFATPADISNKHSFFTHEMIHGAYDVLHLPNDKLTVGNALTLDKYEGGVDSLDLLDNYFYAEYSHAFTDRLYASLWASDQASYVGGSNFRNKITVQPSVTCRWTDWLATKLAVSNNNNEYFRTMPNPAWDRDGQTVTYSLTGYFRILETNLTGRTGYSFSQNDTDGSDFDSKSHALLVSLSHPLPWDIIAEVGYTHIWDDYRYANTLGFPGEKRADDIGIIALQLSRLVKDNLRIFFRYSGVRHDSNIPFYKYDQHVTSVGCLVSL